MTVGVDDNEPVPTELELSTESGDGVARAAARALIRDSARTATSIVTYDSRGSVLILGAEQAADAARARLATDGLHCTLFASQSGELVMGEPGEGIDRAQGQIESLEGHLGSFVTRVAGPEGTVNLARVLGHEREDFDIVLDLSEPALMQHELPPPGYFAVANEAALDDALGQVPELVGEFDKPKFFNYDPNICAHGARNLRGCSRCLDTCPTEAISSLGERIEVDPYLCQGGGVCVMTCPTGAITYAYPLVSELLDDLRRALHRYHDEGGRRPAVLFHDGEQGLEQLAASVAQLPENIIPVQVEEIGSLGMDAWLSVLAYGAHRVFLLAPPALPPKVARELDAQVGYANLIVAGMDYPGDRIRILRGLREQGLTTLRDVPDEALASAAGFAAFDEKRTTIRLAVDHLFEHAQQPEKTVDLPVGAPFGDIEVDRAACTLCMGCVSVCPASALADGGETPKLLFTEANCVQCGLCQTACPEDAVTLVPRFNYESDPRSRARALNEEAPFTCVRCGKPFATASMIERMREKLKGHWMFKDPEQMRRLEMCEDCRIEDMYVSSGALEPSGEPPKPTDPDSQK